MVDVNLTAIESVAWLAHDFHGVVAQMYTKELIPWLLLGGALGAAAGLWMLFRSSREASPQKSTGGLSTLPTGNSQGELAVMEADELVARLKLGGDVNAIAELIGLSRANFATDILPTLHAVVDFVQLLPASEAHHHANPGGLAQHTLDVTRRALAIRGGREIPVGCSPEERAKRKHRWSVGVFLAALFHDMGKPITDVSVHFKDTRTGTRRRWQALTGSMTEMGVTYYQVSFPTSAERDYRAHEKLGVVLLQRCVPQHVLAWLSEDSELMQRLYAMLGGDTEAAGVIAEIVKQADMESTAHNLRHGSRVRFATASQVPLIEVLMQRLRHLLSHVDGVAIPMNASGAAAFVGAEHTWIVVPRVVDLLVEDIKRVDPNRSIPSDRTRIFDTFREFGAIDARPGTTQCVWKIRVRGGSREHGSDFVHELSALRFRTSLLFQGQVKRFDGQVDVVTAEAMPTASAAPSTEILPAPIDSKGASNESEEVQRDTRTPTTSGSISTDFNGLPASNAASVNTALSTTSENTSKPRSRLPSPGAREVMITSAMSPAESNQNVQVASASALLDQLLGESTPQDKSGDPIAPPISTAALNAHVGGDGDGGFPVPNLPVDHLLTNDNAPLPPVAVPHPTNKSTGTAIGPLASGFLRWLQEGLAQQNIDCNGSNAFFHTVEEGVGLVSPRAFQVYAASLAGELLPNQKLPKELSNAVISSVSKIQSELKKSKIVRPNGDKPRPDYFHAYVISSSQKRINMMLIDEPSRFFSSLPPPNRMLARASMQSIS